MNRKEELQNNIKNSRDELNQILKLERIEELKSYIGKYFKLDEGWYFTYILVTGINKDGRLTVAILEKEYDGIHKVYADNDNYFSFENVETWQEITKDQFESKLNESIDEFRTLFEVDSKSEESNENEKV
jgi:hypothetical protein